MYSVQHLLDENEKTSFFRSDNELIGFANLIAKENEDESIPIQTVQQAKDYINEFCPDLKLSLYTYTGV